MTGIPQNDVYLQHQVLLLLPVRAPYRHFLHGFVGEITIKIMTGVL